jgi:hypothetical protein
MLSAEVAMASPRRRPVDMPMAPERRKTATTGVCTPDMRRIRRLNQPNISPI